MRVLRDPGLAEVKKSNLEVRIIINEKTGENFFIYNKKLGKKRDPGLAEVKKSNLEVRIIINSKIITFFILLKVIITYYKLL